MKIMPSKLSGEIRIQPSKSYLHRMIIMAALSKRKVEIHNVNYSDDINATLSALKTMGLADYICKDNSVVISKGDGEIKGIVDCNESGSTLRFLIALGLTMDKDIVFTGRGRLMERPQEVYKDLCQSRGYTFENTGDYLKVKGNLKAGSFSIQGDVSSQFISGLMMALSAYDGESEIVVTGKAESVGYIDITIEVMNMFGVMAKRDRNRIYVNGSIAAPSEVTAQGDWSHAANYACACAKSGGLVLRGLVLNSPQKDCTVVDILKSMGADLIAGEDGIRFESSELSGVDIDGSNIPDIIPVLCVLLGVCEGVHTVRGIGRLRIKESDRIESTCVLINGIGGKVECSEDSITTYGVDSYTGGSVSSYNDHRIAMAAAVASCFSLGIIELDNPACTAKSAPAFWQEFTALGGKIMEETYV